MTHHKFAIKSNRHRAYYAVFMYRDEIMFTSLCFASKQSVFNLIDDIKSNVASAPVVDLT